MSETRILPGDLVRFVFTCFARKEPSYVPEPRLEDEFSGGSLGIVVSNVHNKDEHLTFAFVICSNGMMGWVLSALSWFEHV